MIGRKITLNNKINLHDYGIIEDVEYNKLSKPLIEYERAEIPAEIQGRKKEAKDVTVYLRVIKENREKTKKEIDKIVGLSYSESPFLFQLDDKYCEAILVEADDSLFLKYGLLTLVFSNRDGQWYGEEKTQQLDPATSNTIVNEGIIPTDWVEFTARTNAGTVNFTYGDKNIQVLDTDSITEVTIDLKRKKIFDKNLRDTLSISLNSKFGELNTGKTVITSKGLYNFSVKYREVIAL